jgi:hypothetical protein
VELLRLRRGNGSERFEGVAGHSGSLRR